jgi:hypothetical protein
VSRWQERRVRQERQERRVPHQFQEPLVLREHPVQRRPVHRGLPVPAEVAAPVRRGYRERPDSLPAADFVQPAVAVAAAVVEFRADFARTR